MNLKCRKKLKSSQNIKKKLQDKHGLLWSPFSHLNIQSTRRQLGQWRGSPQLYRLTTRTSKYNTLPLRMIDHSNHKSVTPLIWLPLPSAYGSQRPPWLTRLHVSQPCSPTVAHSSICSIWSLPSSLFLQRMSTSPSSELCLGCSFYPKLFPFHLFLSPTHYSGLILDVTMQRGFHEPLRPG